MSVQKDWGQILWNDVGQGVVPDPAKIEALKKLPEPRMKNLLQGFLDIVNYLSRFYPKIADLTHNLRIVEKGQQIHVE